MKTITIRDVEPEFWQQFRSEAVSRGITVSEALKRSATAWFSQNGEKTPHARELWDIKPVRVRHPDARHFSKKADEVLYGWRK
jgi:hypothetical protein